jgi:NTE family protein
MVPHQKTALILSGGGARGAYQVGVLKGLAETLKSIGVENPFRILSGASAGAINTAQLAAATENFETAIEKLVYLWSNLTPEQVFKADVLSLNKFSISSLLGGASKPSLFSMNSLLDTSPLKKLIEKNCDFSQIQKNLDQRKYDSIIVTANNYIEGGAISFVQTPQVFDSEKLNWGDTRRKPIKTNLDSSHILASSAIPILFPPVLVGHEYYGDGCVRNNTPCSPSLRLGAQKLFVIGVRSQQRQTVLASTDKSHPVSMIRILNTLLNAVLLDSVEQDVQRIQRINQLVDGSKNNANLKKIPAICISPSRNIGEIARERSHKLPRILRLTISAFGDLSEASEILSYLMFESDFCKKLIEMGYEDALNSKKEIIQFFSETKAEGVSL